MHQLFLFFPLVIFQSLISNSLRSTPNFAVLTSNLVRLLIIKNASTLDLESNQLAWGQAQPHPATVRLQLIPLGLPHCSQRHAHAVLPLLAFLASSPTLTRLLTGSPCIGHKPAGFVGLHLANHHRQHVRRLAQPKRCITRPLHARVPTCFVPAIKQETQ